MPTFGIKYCKVRGCRFPDSHVTFGHVCGTCGKRGHGIQECGKESLIGRLNCNYSEDTVQEYCTVQGCDDPETHTSESHHCKRCNTRTTDHMCCPLLLTSCICPVCRVENHSVNMSRKVFAPGTECVVCFATGGLVLFDTCGHACVCAVCAQRIGHSQ